MVPSGDDNKDCQAGAMDALNSGGATRPTVVVMPSFSNDTWVIADAIDRAECALTNDVLRKWKVAKNR
jgi:hypothetical protein